MIYILAIYMIFCSIGYWKGQDLRMIQEVFYQISSMLVIAGSLLFNNKKTKFSMFNIPIISFLVWCLALWFIHDNMGWSIAMNTFLGISVYFTIIRTVSKKDLIKIIQIHKIIACFAIFYLVFQIIGYDMRGQFLANVGGIPKCSVFGIENAFGIYLAVLAPFVGYLGILLLIPIVLAKSSGVMIGAIVGILFFYWFQKRIVFWILIIPLLIGGASFICLYDNPMGMQKSRLDMWGKVIQDSHTKPFGRGLDSFRLDDGDGAIRYFKYSYNDLTIRTIKKDDQWLMEHDPNKEFREFVNNTTHVNEKNADLIAQGKSPKRVALNFWDHPHNEYIWLLHEIGFIGIGLLIWFIYLLWRRFWTSTKDVLICGSMASIIIYGIICLTQFPFHLARVGHLFPIILAIFYISTEEHGTT